MIDADLSRQQKDDVAAVLAMSPPIFVKILGLTRLAVHQIPTPEGTVVQNRWRPLPRAQ